MNLETIYFISQVVAAIALVGSLIFVGLQIKLGRKQSEDAERTAKAQVFQQISDAYRQLALSWGSQPNIYRIGLDDPSPDRLTVEERAQYASLMMASMHLSQNIYFQHKNGLLPDTANESFLNFLASLPNCQAGELWWSGRKEYFDSQFVEMMQVRIDTSRDRTRHEYDQLNREVAAKASQPDDELRKGSTPSPSSD